MYDQLSSAEVRIKNLNNYLSCTKGKKMERSLCGSSTPCIRHICSTNKSQLAVSSKK